jgi:hypothetical protein
LLQYLTEYGHAETPKNLQDARRILNERGQYNQALLSKPPFDVLAKAVDVTNTTVRFPEVQGHEFPV